MQLTAPTGKGNSGRLGGSPWLQSQSGYAILAVFCLVITRPMSLFLSIKGEYTVKDNVFMGTTSKLEAHLVVYLHSRKVPLILVRIYICTDILARSTNSRCTTLHYPPYTRSDWLQTTQAVP